MSDRPPATGSLPPPHDSLAPESRQPPEFRSPSPPLQDEIRGRAELGLRTRNALSGRLVGRKGRAAFPGRPFPLPSWPPPTPPPPPLPGRCLAGANASDLPQQASRAAEHAQSAARAGPATRATRIRFSGCSLRPGGRGGRGGRGLRGAHPRTQGGLEPDCAPRSWRGLAHCCFTFK